MMKRIVSLLALVLLCIVAEAESVMVNVKGVTEKTSKTVAVYVNGANRNSVKLNVTDGVFEYKGTVDKESFLLFWDSTTRRVCWVVADGSEISLDMVNDRMHGTALNDKLSAINDTLNAHRKNEESFRKKAEQEQDERKAVLLRAKAREEKRVARDFLVRAIDENKDNCLPALLIYCNGIYLDNDKLLAYATGNDYYVNHHLFQSVRYLALENKQKFSVIGKKFIDMEVKDAEGKSHKLGEYVGKGNYVLIDFWASWCNPCMGEMPTVKKAKTRYGKMGFEVVGISLDNDAARWQGAVKTAGLDWVQLSNLVGWEEPGVKKYNVKSIPSNFLCNGDGVIVAVDLRGSSLLEQLEDIYDVK